jgi:hypothetical protein
MTADKPPQGRDDRPDDDHRKGGATASRDPSLWTLLLADVRNRYRRNPGRSAGLAVGAALVGALGVVAFLVFGVGGGADPRTDAAAAGATPAAAPTPAPAARPPHQGDPIDSAHPEPEQPLPPDNPAVPNDAQGVDAQALLDHMIQERKIPLTGADDRAQLQRIADEAVAREQADFAADDRQITDAVAATFGSLTTQQKADTVRCVAEFAERVYAQKHGTIPPDEADGQPGFGRGGG